MDVIARPRGLLVIVALWSAVAALLGSTAGPVAANNLGGSFTLCGQLVEFVAPSDADAGRLTLVGIGAGHGNEPGDDESHHFPFAPDLALGADVVADLQSLANGLSFTCLAMTTGSENEDPGLLLVKALLLDRQVDQCGTVERERDGTYVLKDDGTFGQTSIISDAETLLGGSEGWRLHGLLAEAAQSPDPPRICLHFQLGPDGVVEAITFDGQLRYCDPAETGAAYRMAGDVYIWPETLLPEATLDATMFLFFVGAEACWEIDVTDSELLEIIASGYGDVCGYAYRDEHDRLLIDEVLVPERILRQDQLDDLNSAVWAGGTACLGVLIERNAVSPDVTVTLPLEPEPEPEPSPSPTPSATPSPTAVAPAVPTVSPTPVPTRSPIASPTVRPTPSPSPSPTDALAGALPVAAAGGDGFVTPLLALVLVVLVLAAIYAIRRARAAEQAEQAEELYPADDFPSVDRSWLTPVDLQPAGLAVGGSVSPQDSYPTAAVPVALVMPEPGVTASSEIDRAQLTRREREVLAMLATGLSNRRIGEALFIAESTAGVHVSNIMGKLGAATRTEAAAIAHRAGLVGGRPDDQGGEPVH